MGYDPVTNQYNINGIWVDEMFTEDTKLKVFYGGLWPIYWVDVIDPVLVTNPAEVVKLSKDYKYRGYFIGKKRMVAHLVKLKFKHPDAKFVKY